MNGREASFVALLLLLAGCGQQKPSDSGANVENENGVWKADVEAQGSTTARIAPGKIDQYGRLFQLRILLLKQSKGILDTIKDEATAESAAARWRNLFPIQVEAEYLEGRLVEFRELDDRRMAARDKYGPQVERLRRMLLERQGECQKLPFFQKVNKAQQEYSEDLLSVEPVEVQHGHGWRVNGSQFVIWLPPKAPPEIDMGSEEGSFEVLVVDEESGSLHPQREHIPHGGKAVLPRPNNEQGTLYWLRPILGHADETLVRGEKNG